MSRHLKILHLVNASDAGGLSRYVMELAVATKAAGHQVAVAGDTGVWQTRFEQRGVEWVHVPFNSKLGALKGVKAIKQWLDTEGGRGPWRGGVDLFHTHYRKPTWTARFLQRKKRPPVLYTLHLSDLKVGGLAGLLSDWGDHTHVASSEAKEWMLRAAKVPADRITLIPHGVDPALWPIATPAMRAKARREFSLTETDLVAAYVGRLDQNHPKNAHWALTIAQRMPNLKLLIAGDGPDMSRMQKLVNDMNLNSRVQLLGEREPRPVYHAADLLLLPSGREGFSLVTAEAMSCGLPVLRTRTAGTKELIVEDGTGDSTGKSTPIDETAFTTAATQLLADPQALKTMGTAAAKHIREKFTFRQQIDSTLKLYEELVG